MSQHVTLITGVIAEYVGRGLVGLQLIWAFMVCKQLPLRLEIYAIQRLLNMRKLFYKCMSNDLRVGFEPGVNPVCQQ